MLKQKNIWTTIELEQAKYNSLQLGDMKDYEKFYLYSIIAHSTAIEGSTLSEKDTQLLLDEGVTKKGSLVEHLMNIDLKNAYEFAFQEAKKKTDISTSFLKTLNALVMKDTGSINHHAVGTFDSSKGDYRLCGVTAGFGGKSYMDYRKISDNMENLSQELNKRLNTTNGLEETYNLSFDAHFNLVSIHPWLDGNGRTSRLLMNYIQAYHGLVPTKVHKGDKIRYIKALEKSREKESLIPFREFMAKQHLKTLREEIRNHTKNQNDNNSTLLF